MGPRFVWKSNGWTSTPKVATYVFSNSPVKWRLTKVVLPTPPSPTRTSLNSGILLACKEKAKFPFENEAKCERFAFKITSDKQQQQEMICCCGCSVSLSSTFKFLLSRSSRCKLVRPKQVSLHSLVGRSLSYERSAATTRDDMLLQVFRVTFKHFQVSAFEIKPLQTGATQTSVIALACR